MGTPELALSAGFATPTGFERLRVMHVMPTLEIGGLERVAASLAINVRGRVARVSVCSPSATPFEQILRGAGIDVHLITAPIPRPSALAASAHDVFRIMRRERPHLLHAHNPAAGLVAHAARVVSAPRPALVTTYQGVADRDLARAARILARTADLVVACGTEPARELVAYGVPQAQVVTVLNGVTAAPRRAAEDVRREFGALGSPLVVNVGRYVEQKNQELLLDALALVRRTTPNLRALVVGGGARETELRARAGQRALEDIVTITGEREDAVDLIAAADVFVLSSRWEGHPVTLVEAMSVGRAIVATAVRGINEVVDHERTGLLVPPDDPAALASAISHVLSDRALRRRLGENGQAVARRRFSEDVMLERYAHVYASVLERGGKPLTRL